MHQRLFDEERSSDANAVEMLPFFGLGNKQKADVDQQLSDVVSPTLDPNQVVRAVFLRRCQARALQSMHEVQSVY